MALQIKRSTSNAAPITLEEGELAYSFVSDTLFIGNTSNVVINIGGSSFVEIIENRTSLNVANSLVARDTNGRVQLNQIEVISSPSLNNHASTKQYTDQIANTAKVYSSNVDDGVVSITVGGATPQSAAYWKTKQITEVLDAILFPDINPTYVIPTLSFSGTVSGIREIGETISQSISVTGVENDVGPFTSIAIRRQGSNISTSSSLTAVPTSNIGSQFGYADPNNPNFSYTHSHVDSNVVASGTTTWSAISAYNAGLAKLNNKGVLDSRPSAVRSVDAPQSACSAFQAASTTSVTGIYPYFWGVSGTQPNASGISAAIQAGSTNKVLADSSGTVSVTFNASAQFVWMAHPAANATKTKWYNTALNNGDIGAGQFILAPVTNNTNSPNAYWNGVPYKIYISGFATTTSGSIEFRNS